MEEKIRELWEYATDDNVNKEEQKEVEKGALAFMTSLGDIDTANKIAATFFYTGAILAMQSAQEEIERLKEIISDASEIFNDIDKALDEIYDCYERQEMQGNVIEVRKIIKEAFKGLEG